MADAFIDVDIEVDEQTLADGAIDRLRTEWPGWEPNDGDLEVVGIEAHAAMVSDAAAVAGVMPAAAFRTILGKLHGVFYTAAEPARTTVTLHMLDADPHTIDAGTELDIDGFAFSLDEDTPTAALAVAGVPVTASEDGADANNLTGDVVTLISASRFIDHVTVDAPTAGGSDAETDEQLQDRGSRELQLQAKTLVTTRDYELMSLSRPFVGRVVATSDPVDRQIEVTPGDPSGNALPGVDKDDLLALLNGYRLSTWEVTITDPTITVIDVTYVVHPYPGYDEADLVARINAELTLWLDTATWGQPREFGDVASTSWLVEPTVRVNKVIDLIGPVEGVDYVVSVDLNGSAGAEQPNGDWLMPGSVPLARAGTLTGSVA